MIKVEGLKLPLNYDEEALKAALCKKLGLKKSDIKEITLLREALDARKKPHLFKVVSVACTLFRNEGKLVKAKKAAVYEPYHYTLPENCYADSERPIVAGAGPAGLFGGLVLAMAGTKPLIIEGGKEAAPRHRDILDFCDGGKLLPQSNIQFGEGGAGMFSDGKLTTGTKDPRHRFILETMIACGAPKAIGYMAKPHIGSDLLGDMSAAIREKIRALGGSFAFKTRLEDIIVKNRKLEGIVLADAQGRRELPCHHLLLAVGHSARTTMEMLHSHGVELKPKAFSIGARIEHLQRDINIAQYGEARADLTADYKLSTHLENGRSVYTFCMCPGGTVVPAASEPGGVVTNGMSEWARDTTNANSALLVSVRPEDFPGEGPLAGMYWQRQLEQKAFALGGSSYFAPAQRVGDFLKHRPTAHWGKVTPSYRPGVTMCDLADLFPPFITESLRAALPMLGKKLRGFDDDDAVLTAIETRSSSPCRTVRDESGQCSIAGIFPAGEGSGYAGGIMSSAADGMRSAENIIKI